MALRTFQIDVPESPESDRFDNHLDVPILEAFLLWLGDRYQVRDSEDWNSDEPIELSWDFIRREIIANYLGFNYGTLRNEARAVELAVEAAVLNQVKIPNLGGKR